MSVFTYVIADETRSFRSKRPRFCQTRSVCRFSADNIAVSGLTEMLSIAQKILMQDTGNKRSATGVYFHK